MDFSCPGAAAGNADVRGQHGFALGHALDHDSKFHDRTRRGRHWGIAIATGGLTYAFHGVIEEFIRKISGTVVAIGAAVGAGALLTALYAVRAATV
jgi:hypothetical protein